jgi:hypothetical protein
MEAILREQGKDEGRASLAEMDAVWDLVKAAERRA